MLNFTDAQVRKHHEVYCSGVSLIKQGFRYGRRKNLENRFVELGLPIFTQSEWLKKFRKDVNKLKFNDKDTASIKNLFLVKKKGLNEISKELDCSRVLVKNYLKRMSIDVDKHIQDRKKIEKEKKKEGYPRTRVLFFIYKGYYHL